MVRSYSDDLLLLNSYSSITGEIMRELGSIKFKKRGEQSFLRLPTVDLLFFSIILLMYHSPMDEWYDMMLLVDIILIHNVISYLSQKYCF